VFRSVRARPAERTRPLPGDELLPNAVTSPTHAISIRRAPHEVWPWLVQMGAGRAGWYSYDFIDNGRRPSARRIVPELQHAELGGIFPAMPGITDGFTVLQVDPGRSLVLGWLPPGRPAPMTTWAFVLEDAGAGSTRLIVRARGGADYRPPFGLPRWTTNTLVRWGHGIMQRKQLLGIAERAEASQEGATRARARCSYCSAHG
jgi:hypothetical protein